MKAKRKCNKVVFVLFILFVIIFNWKIFDYYVLKSDSKAIAHRAAAIVYALNNREAEPLYQMFSETAKSASLSLKSDIQYLIDYIDGEIIQDTLIGGDSGNSQHIQGVLHEKKIYGNYKLETVNTQYSLVIVESVSNQWFSNFDGLSTLCLVKTDELYRYNYYVDKLPLGIIGEFNIDIGSIGN
ncbi:MAG: DUF5104 domain-containing protein [Oscillospiraceae bacterium]|jgi:hypothetical protein|nr:DUF5104 domain-containing protein [Oscillospiraceae bacterium]